MAYKCCVTVPSCFHVPCAGKCVQNRLTHLMCNLCWIQFYCRYLKKRKRETIISLPLLVNSRVSFSGLWNDTAFCLIIKLPTFMFSPSFNEHEHVCEFNSNSKIFVTFQIICKHNRTHLVNTILPVLMMVFWGHVMNLFMQTYRNVYAYT